jgi:hypothetical protein
LNHEMHSYWAAALDNPAFYKDLQYFLSFFLFASGTNESRYMILLLFVD